VGRLHPAGRDCRSGGADCHGRAVTDGGEPVTVLAEKTRIALHVRMSFAAFMPRRNWLNGHLVLARRVDSPRFHKIETYPLERPARVPAEHTRRDR